MTDTHTHLYLPEFAAESRETVARSIEAGVDRMVFPNVDASTLDPMLGLAAEFPENVSVAVGLHPTELTADWHREIRPIEDTLSSANPVAVGEVGMDLYWDKTFRDAQAEAFDYQLQWGRRLGLPVIIHCREALDETLGVLRNFSGPLPQCIFHCFTGSVSDVQAIRRVTDPFFGIGGVVTFKNAHDLREALPEIGLARILLETDSPYLAPMPHRGKRNESSYLPYICSRIAADLGVSEAEVEHATDLNAESLHLCSR